MKRSISVVNWGAALHTLRNRFGALPAVSTPTGEYKFSEVLGRAGAVAKSLIERDVRPGEPVAIFLPNEAHAVWASFGVLISGAAETSLNCGLSPEELRYCLDLLKVRYVISDKRLANIVRSSGHDPLLIEDLDNPLTDFQRDRPVEGDRWGKILFTSGTTGKPKAIVHSHERRWLANLMLRSSLPFMPGPGSRLLLMTPYSHGSSLLAAAFFDSGASIYLMDGVQTDLVRKLISSGEVDSMFAPPTVLAKIVSSLDDFSCRTLRTIFTGTATLPPSLYRRTRDMFGPIVRVTYGKTEIFNPITVLEPKDVDEAYGSENVEEANLGWPVSGVEIQIRDEGDAVCPPGASGRIYLRAPHMLVAYIDSSGSHAVGDDDWHESGDIGALTPKGALLLKGREHDVIKTGGYKLFPQEIEAPLIEAGVAIDVVAIGIPSHYWGQFVIVVAERPNPGWEARAQQAVASLSKYKHPRAYIALAELPRNVQGKLQRGKVSEIILQRYQIEDGPHPELRPRPETRGGSEYVQYRSSAADQ